MYDALKYGAVMTRLYFIELLMCSAFQNEYTLDDIICSGRSISYKIAWALTKNI